MPKGDFIGEFELYALLATVHLDDEAYGIRIRQEIERRTGREIAIGAIYATLGRLRDKALVEFTLSAPEPVQGGRARKHYSLTPAGARAVRHSTAMLTKMMAGADLR
jgi:PadR family transcriptional regulator, regulatory protein PadR